MTIPQKGDLLLASDQLKEGLFFRSVILICDNSDAGCFGVLLSRPLDVAIPDEILPEEPVSNPSVSLRFGGPLSTSQLLLLHTLDPAPEGMLSVCPHVTLGGDIDFLHANLANAAGSPLILCFGYVAWPGPLLHKECQAGDWLIARASKALIFDTPADKLWAIALRTLGGPNALLADIPENLDLN